jgi:hypothetical protein
MLRQIINFFENPQMRAFPLRRWLGKDYRRIVDSYCWLFTWKKLALRDGTGLLRLEISDINIYLFMISVNCFKKENYREGLDYWFCPRQAEVIVVFSRSFAKAEIINTALPIKKVPIIHMQLCRVSMSSQLLLFVPTLDLLSSYSCTMTGAFCWTCSLDGASGRSSRFPHRSMAALHIRPPLVIFYFTKRVT